MHDSFFVQLNSEELALFISKALGHVCYAGPGIQMKPAQALIDLADRLGPELILVFLDVNENVIRMGYGEIQAIEAMQKAGIRVEHIAGLRNGLIVADGNGFSYTPTALFLEREARSDEALNAMRLTPDQVAEAMARLSPASKSIALAQADTSEKKQAIQEATSETKPVPVDEVALKNISEKLKAAPPAQFDVARQVRVFQPHFQYIELRMTGAAIQRHKLAIPKSIQNIGSDKELKGRLKTTFDLIDKDANVSSSALDKELRDIRNKLTRSLGKEHGRIIRKATLPKLEERLEQLREKMAQHQEAIRENLEATLSKSKALMVDYYLPIVEQYPPDELYGLFGEPSGSDIRNWLEGVLAKAFPKPDALVNKIKLEVNYKDVTFATLNRDDFLASIKSAYPELDWEKTYEEFRAAGEFVEADSGEEKA
jgi:predicted hydrocarbon binding protein